MISITVTAGRQHKKKPSGIFGYASSFFPDLVPKVSQHLLKIAFKRLTQNEFLEEEHPEDCFYDEPYYESGGKRKHHHHHKHKKVIYKPVYVEHEHPVQPEQYVQPYDIYHMPAYYATGYAKYSPSLPADHSYTNHDTQSIEPIVDNYNFHSL